MRHVMVGNRPWLAAAAAVLLVFLVIVYFMGTVLLPLGISVVSAYVMLPVARLLERGMPWRHDRPGLARGTSVGVIFLGSLAGFAGLLVVVVPPAIEQGEQFIGDFPVFLYAARVTVEGWIILYIERVPQGIRDQIELAAASAGSIVGGAALNVGQQTLAIVTGSFAFILALATTPVLVFYLMKDSGRITESLHAPFPAAMRPYFRDILAIADRTIGGYLRGQLALGLVVGTIVGAGLLILGVRFAVILGIVAGLTELVPIIGPWIGAAAGVVVTLATEPGRVLWVILLYFVVQMLENTLLVPRIQAGALSLHPVVVILIISVGSNYFGLWAVILGPPLVALGKDIIIYFAQQWSNPLPAAAEPEAEAAPTPAEATTAEVQTAETTGSEE